MSAVTADTHSVISVNTAARSVTWCANESVRLLLQITQSRGLRVDTLHEDLDFYLKGIRTWMTTHHLTAVVLEVWDNEADRVIERYDLIYDYRPVVPTAEERFETHIEKLIAGLPEGQLPAHCKYRVVLKKERDAPDLPGWKTTELRDVDHLERRALGQVIDTACIGVDVEIHS